MSFILIFIIFRVHMQHIAQAQLILNSIIFHISMNLSNSECAQQAIVSFYLSLKGKSFVF